MLSYPKGRPSVRRETRQSNEKITCEKKWERNVPRTSLSDIAPYCAGALRVHGCVVWLCARSAMPKRPTCSDLQLSWLYREIWGKSPRVSGVNKSAGSEAAARICPRKSPPKRPNWESYFLQGIIGKTHTQNLQILREDTLGATCSAGPFCLVPRVGS